MMRTRNLGLRAEAGGEAGGGGAGGAAGGGAGSGGAATPFYETFKDQATKDWLKSYGDAYPDPESVAIKARNLEQFLGADKANRGIIVPKDLSKQEELLPIFRKLGASDNIDAYKVDEKVAKDPVVMKLREHAHAVGMPVAHFNSTMQLLAGVVKEQQDTRTAKFESDAQADLDALHKEWVKPGEYDKNVELGRRAAKMFIPHKDADELEGFLTKMEGALGTGAMMRMWAAIGSGLSEHSFIDDSSRPSGGMTPEAARVRIVELKADKEFGKKLLDGDAASLAEWERLHKTAVLDQDQPQ